MMSRVTVITCCVLAAVLGCCTLFTDYYDAVYLIGAFMLLGVAALFNHQCDLQEEDAAIRNRIRKERMLENMRLEEAFKMQLRREAIAREYCRWDTGRILMEDEA